MNYYLETALMFVGGLILLPIVDGVSNYVANIIR